MLVISDGYSGWAFLKTPGKGGDQGSLERIGPFQKGSAAEAVPRVTEGDAGPVRKALDLLKDARNLFLVFMWTLQICFRVDNY